jgi:carbon storage regulator
MEHGTMLILSRKTGQQIVLPCQGVTISVLGLGKSNVRLGIVAPHDAPVHRNEVWQRICREAGGVDQARASASRRAAV